MKALIVLSTMSNSGKSFITAGLLRVLKKDGYKVCPFKSQNMALNSYITKDGKEIGMAQAMQAFACDIEPNVYMNPILLKPNSDVGSQIILNGEAIGNMKASDYFKNKYKFIPHIKKAYEELSKEYDICIIEGAGSPAEINLKQNDIVNLGLAKLIDCNAILVGDIDRGGVFAGLYGTIGLLEKDERDRIKGLIINKFRGDIEILKPGLRMLENLVSKKFIGCIPYSRIDIADEDSLSLRLYCDKPIKAIDIAVIQYPHISNFTDFDNLERFENVSLRYVKAVNEFKNPDIVILPGSKNTIEDLLYIRQNGLEALILKHAYSKKMIIGICAGFQILGKELLDLKNVENGLKARGLGLLNIKTVFDIKKQTRQIKLNLKMDIEIFKALKKRIISGYEIHMGKSTNLGNEKSLFEGDDKNCIGLINKTENIFGTYLHGLFENDDFTFALLSYIAGKKNISLEKPINRKEYIENEYDRLEKLIRDNIDMNEIYKILGIEKC